MAYYKLMKNLINILREIGLEGKEVSIYLALLELGNNPASTIAKKTEQNRSSCYLMLEKLMKKGFVQKIIKGNIAYFQAAEISFILNRLIEKHRALGTKITEMHATVTQLNKIKNNIEIKPKVAFHHGGEGIQNIMENTLTAESTIYTYASLDELALLLPNYFKQYFQRRKAKNIFMKAILPASIKSFICKKLDQIELRESRLIPVEFNFHLHIFIYDHKVAIISTKEQFGILIESIEMAEAQKRIFETVWKVTKHYNDSLTASFEKEFREKHEI